MTNRNNNLGNIIKERRVLIPLALRDLAAKSGVSPSHLGRIERGERFPSAHVLQRIAGPLGFEVGELFIRAGYLSPQASTTRIETSTAGLDPRVAKMLAQEPITVQRAVLGILNIMEFLGRATRSADLPELREYLQQKYPRLDEDLITMIEDLISRSDK